MSQTKSFLARFFGFIWALFVGIYRVLVIVTVLSLALLAWTAFHGGTVPRVEDNIALAVIPTGTLVDQTDSSSQGLIRQLSNDRPTETSLRDLIDALDAAAKDSRIPFAVVKLDDLEGGGLPQVQELAAAMQRFRASGKPIYAFGESFDQAQYYIAAQADEVSLDPMGSVLLEGFSAYTNYFKDALDKLGVQVHIFRHGQFKSAVEPFLRNDMSPEAKLANQAWLSDLWSVYNQDVSAARKLPDNAADTYVRSLAEEMQKDKGDGANVALTAKLVTRSETQAEFRKRLGVKVGLDKDKATFRQIDFASYLRAVRHDAKKTPSHKIALVVVQGEIVDGDSDETHAGGDSISELLDEARRDDDVEGVLMRVNSPGGSVFASEKIRRAVSALKADGKPVYVSMSTLAASGGYWISMNADQIWAEPSTITGSIGIFGMIPTIDEPLAKLGIHTDGVGTTPLAGALRMDRPLAPEVSTILQAQIEKGYQNFIQGVAQARKLPVDKVDAIAQGRVWSGEAAKGLGLVDQFGGLKDAVAALAKSVKLGEDDYVIDEMQPPHDWLSQVFGRYFSESRFGARFTSSLIRGLLPTGAVRDEAERLGDTLRSFNDPRGEYAYCFCQPSMGAGMRAR